MCCADSDRLILLFCFVLAYYYVCLDWVTQPCVAFPLSPTCCGSLEPNVPAEGGWAQAAGVIGSHRLLIHIDPDFTHLRGPSSLSTVFHICGLLPTSLSFLGSLRAWFLIYLSLLGFLANPRAILLPGASAISCLLHSEKLLGNHLRPSMQIGVKWWLDNFVYISERCRWMCKRWFLSVLLSKNVPELTSHLEDTA